VRHTDVLGSKYLFPLKKAVAPSIFRPIVFPRFDDGRLRYSNINVPVVTAAALGLPKLGFSLLCLSFQ